MSTTAPRPAGGPARRPLGRRTRITLATLVTLTALGGGTVAAHAAVTPTSSSSSSSTPSSSSSAPPTGTASPDGGTATTTPPAPPADGATPPAPPADGATPAAPPADGATPPAPPADGLAHGDVTAVSGDSLTISGPEGDKTFTLDSSTSVVREQGPGTEPASASASDLAVGEHVHVAAVDDSADPLVAATVTIMPAPPAPGATPPAPPADGATPPAPPTDGTAPATGSAPSASVSPSTGS